MAKFVFPTRRQLTTLSLAPALFLGACALNPPPVMGVDDAGAQQAAASKPPMQMAMEELHRKVDALAAADQSRRTVLANQQEQMKLMQQEVQALRGELDQTKHSADTLIQQMANLRAQLGGLLQTPITAQGPAQPGAMTSQMNQMAAPMGMVGQNAMAQPGVQAQQQQMMAQQTQQPMPTTPQQAAMMAQQAQMAMNHPGRAVPGGRQPMPGAMQPPQAAQAGNMNLYTGPGAAPNGATNPPSAVVNAQTAQVPAPAQTAQQAPQAQQAPMTKPATAKEAYDKAFLFLQAGQYDQALNHFKQFLVWFPDSDLSDNAQYWIGEMYYVQQDYENALVAFNEVYSKWTSSDKVPGSLLKMGKSFAAINDHASARKALQLVLQYYPDDPAAAQAKQELAQLDQMAAQGAAARP
ncbi:tol-pal system protein YbgF [Magnetofaba australis]|uniref:Cell division coordinator CpoB n=1 Tax=Magnetofaba australis IT-1 TaxID=1434232 RepID=A0A1Y2K165_9PROT|nr:tol-pal system protein YbgF [Magnetofaba australis]OSM01748.1 hypothetical protein MAIT1_01780 [Magnetofaba australis IT-1]